MNKMKIVFAALLIGLVMQPTIAGHDDLSYDFGASPDTLQIDLLTTQDIEATQGSWWRANIRYYHSKPHRFTSNWGPSQGATGHIFK